MLLAVDIGNTNINLGLFKGRRLLRRAALSVTGKSHFRAIKGFISQRRIDDAIVCSVVPALTRKVERDLCQILRKRPRIINRDIQVKLRNLYRNPKQVGPDRLVNAYAGISLYQAPLIVVDFGTAITFDAVSAKKEYLGGMILPGLGISLDCLAERAALLPKIKLATPAEFIGRDSRNSMLSGIIYGFAALCDSLSTRIKDKIGNRAKVVGTGGNIGIIAKYCRKLDKIDRDLTLKGLNLIYTEWRKEQDARFKSTRKIIKR